MTGAWDSPVTVPRTRRPEEPIIATPTHEALAATLVALGDARQQFDRAVSTHRDTLRWEEAALLLRMIREEVTLLRAIESTIERRIIEARREQDEYGQIEVDGVGVVALHRPKNRKAWDHSGLAAEVVESHLIERGGEVPSPWEVRDWIMDAVGVSYWRVGVLRALGIAPENYCEETPGAYTVQII